MSYEIITIPFNSVTKTFDADDLNAFCINKKVISTKIEFFKDEKHAYWTIFIEYETILEKNNNEPVGLTEAGKLCYEKLREWRKETAEKEGIPPYVIAKNSHLGEIVKKEIKTLEALKQLNGFGVKKIEKYGKDISGKFPKNVRFNLADRLTNISLDVVEAIIEAIYAKEKADILRRANLYIEKMRALLQISVDTK